MKSRHLTMHGYDKRLDSGNWRPMKKNSLTTLTTISMPALTRKSWLSRGRNITRCSPKRTAVATRVNRPR